MKTEYLRDLGFQLQGRAAGGESGGAWFAIAANGEPVVLKWFADERKADRYTQLLPALDVLRSRGVPVPEYSFVGAFEGWTLSAQQVLPGQPAALWEPHLVHRMIECVSAKADIIVPLSPPALESWGHFITHTLGSGSDGWVQHSLFRAYSDRFRRIIDIVESVRASAKPSWFPTTGLVHFDLHTDNVLTFNDSSLAGIVDWEDACAGDHRYDLVAFAFDLHGHGQDIWEEIEPLIEPHVLLAYAAHMVLRRTDWAIRHHPEDVPRQLERAESVLHRFGT